MHQTFQHFRLFKKMKKWFIFDENLPDFVGTTAYSKAKSRNTISFNFCSLSLKKLVKMIVFFFIKNRVFSSLFVFFVFLKICTYETNTSPTRFTSFCEVS